MSAATRVFARKGFHSARVADIASEAGVAHGLIYHYFTSKDELLDTILHETWHALVEQTTRIEASGAPLEHQLARFAHVYLRSWLESPDLILVLVREVGRSPEVDNRAGELSEVFALLTRMIEFARDRGEVRADCEPRLAAWTFYGALEEILTGWVLGLLPGGAEDVERSARSVVEVTCRGLAP